MRDVFLWAYAVLLLAAMAGIAAWAWLGAARARVELGASRRRALASERAMVMAEDAAWRKMASR